jgi:hypothetical protein
MTHTYHKGNSIKSVASFKVGGELTDPTTVTLKVKDPTETITSYTYALAEVTKSSTGVYYKEIPSDLVGIWRVEWIGTGACVAVDEDFYIIEPCNFP